jgi:hypothetical protein
MIISLDLITAALSFLFTLIIFSYLIGDNPLFRIAVYTFVGVSSGYVAAVIFRQIIVMRLFQPFITALISGSMTEKGLTLVPVILSLLIFMKISPRLAGMGRVAMAFLVGVVAAITIAGALTGTLIPQVMGAINTFDLNAAVARNIEPYEAIGSGAITLAGTIFTLIYFHFGAHPKADGSMRRMGLIEIFAWIGRIFIGITLGAIFAGVYAAALTALIERIASLINFVGKFL